MVWEKKRKKRSREDARRIPAKQPASEEASFPAGTSVARGRGTLLKQVLLKRVAGLPASAPGALLKPSSTFPGQRSLPPPSYLSILPPTAAAPFSTVFLLPFWRAPSLLGLGVTMARAR